MIVTVLTVVVLLAIIITLCITGSLRRQYISNPKQPSCKKRVRPSKRRKIQGGSQEMGYDGRLMVKISITTIQVNFGAAWSIGTKFT